MKKMQIKELEKDNYDSVNFIYKQGIETNLATFQMDCPTFEEWDKAHFNFCRFGMFDEDRLIGWIALTPVSNRCVYSGLAEVSIYVDNNNKGKGIGHSLLMYLIEQSELKGIWTLQASIMQNNISSINLFKKCGFREVGYREKIGRDKYGVWRNTILVERRSSLPEFNIEEKNYDIISCDKRCRQN